MTAQDLIKTLSLKPLEGEGGYYSKVLTFTQGPVVLGGSIYYLITPESFSSLHLLSSDEGWYFLEGDPVEQLVLYPDGTQKLTVLGKVSEGHTALTLVEGGCYQGTRLCSNIGWALCATTMCPPYDATTFILAKKELKQRYPDCTMLEHFLNEED